MRFAGSQNNVDFSPMPLSSGASGGNYSAAADIVNINDSFGALSDKNKFDQISHAAIETEAAAKIAAMDAEANVMSTGLQAYGQTKSYALAKEAQIEAAQEKRKSQETSSMLKAFGAIAGPALSLLKFSDETTKFDVKRIDTALETLRNLRPVTFHYKEEFSSSPERMHHGFIAQEFQKVLPDATYFDESIGKLAIDTGDVIGLLVRANQELEARIGMLEAKQALATV